jgi:hypothetical protein
MSTERRVHMDRALAISHGLLTESQMPALLAAAIQLGVTYAFEYPEHARALLDEVQSVGGDADATRSMAYRLVPESMRDRA